LRVCQPEVTAIPKVHGLLQGLKASQIHALERLYRRRIPDGQMATVELADTMCAISAEIQREVAVIVNRRGQIITVAVGDAEGLTVPRSDIGYRESLARLSGLRCLHTHPRGGGLSRGDLITLAKNRFDFIAALEVDDGRAGQVYLAHLVPPVPQQPSWRVHDPLPLRQWLKQQFDEFLADVEVPLARSVTAVAVDSKADRAYIVGVVSGDGSLAEAEDSLAELALLADTAGATVVGRVLQKREKVDPATLIGSGKAQELSLLVQETQATLVVFDEELSPIQANQLDTILGVRVVDRTQLILDIFAQRAQSKEGKLQVELAQLHYLMPRLVGRGQAMSRLGGGIGTRGPGETKLEVDRRRIRGRISQLEREVQHLQTHRRQQRRSRTRHGLVMATLIGYTNAGKSSLLNALTTANVLAENKLFATLDPRTRRLLLPDGRTLLITDTVGFIRKLPTELVAAFRATLEEVTESDVLLHVVDASDPHAEAHIAAVEDIVFELDAYRKPVLTVLNKADQASPLTLAKLRQICERPVVVSATTGRGLADLVRELDRLAAPLRPDWWAAKASRGSEPSSETGAFLAGLAC
jgi:GTP-binding protein HflX